jgi:hypothetical protein
MGGNEFRKISDLRLLISIHEEVSRPSRYCVQPVKPMAILIDEGAYFKFSIVIAPAITQCPDPDAVLQRILFDVPHFVRKGTPQRKQNRQQPEHNGGSGRRTQGQRMVRRKVANHGTRPHQCYGKPPDYQTSAPFACDPKIDTAGRRVGRLEPRWRIWHVAPGRVALRVGKNTATSGYDENELPQPQDLVEFGLTNTKPCCIRVS